MFKKVQSILMIITLVAVLFVNCTTAAYAKTTLKITEQPKTVTVPSGENATVTVKATGDSLKYVWYYKNADGSKYKKTSTTKNTYTVKMSESKAGRKVYCLITDKYGDSVKSKTVTLKRGKTLKIVDQPSSETFVCGTKTDISFAARGDGLSYRWYYMDKDGTEYKKSSVTSKTYAIKMTSSADGRKVYCLVTDKYGKTKKTNKVTLSLVHDFDSGKVTKTATCEKNGELTYTCSACDKTKKETISKVGHKPNKGKITKKPTCTTEGIKTFTCKTGGEVLKTETVSKISHSSDDGTITKKPTCTKDGEEVFKCEDCGAVIKTQKIAKLEHKSGKGVVTKNATCKAEGVRTFKCKTGGEVLKTEAISKVDHTLGEGVITKDPTCTQEGVKTFSCEVCNEVIKTEKVSKVAHESDNGVITKAPTYTEEGVKTYKCLVCLKTIKTEVVKKLSTEENETSSLYGFLPEDSKIGGKSWTEVLASMPQKLSGTKLVMYNWNPASQITGVPETINRFTKQTGINVEWKTVIYSSYFVKLPALIASGENIPDIVRCRAPQPSFMMNLQPLNNLSYDFTDEAWDQSLMDVYTYGGNTFATSLQNTNLGNVNLMFYNKELIDKYDFEDPYTLWKAGKWNWDKYIEMAREYANLTGNVGSCGEGHFSYYTSFFGLQGAIAYDGEKFYNAMKTKNFLEVHQTIADLYNKEQLFAFGNAERFNDGQVLFSIGSAVHLRIKNAYFGNLKNTKNLYAVPFPKISEQDVYYQGVGETVAYGIAEGAQNAEAVPYFLRYFLDSSNYSLSTFFCNKQNLEVYNWCKQQENKIYSYGYPQGMAGTVNGSIEVQQGDQMESYIDANYGVTDNAVKEYNDIISELKAK